MNNRYFADDDLIMNTATRIPICLCIDTSGSMSRKDDGDKSRIERVQDGIALFNKEIREDEMTALSAEVSIVAFSDDAEIVQDFKTVDNISRKPTLKPHKGGDLGKGVLLALDILEQRKRSYRENGVDYYQPWLIIMSDGRPTNTVETGVDARVAEAQERALRLQEEKKLTVITVFIGDSEEDMDVEDIDEKAHKCLSGFSNNAPVLQITEGTKFAKFFTWLGKSVSVASAGNDIELDFTDMWNWDEI